jgi:hypothetical protein
MEMKAPPNFLTLAVENLKNGKQRLMKKGVSSAMKTSFLSFNLIISRLKLSHDERESTLAKVNVTGLMNIRKVVIAKAKVFRE